MTKITLLAQLVLLVGLGSTGHARAEELESQWNNDWSCGTAFAPTPALVKAATSAPELTIGFVGDRRLAPFLVSQLDGPYKGSVLLVKSARGWQGYAIEALASPAGAFIDTRHGSVVIFSQVTTESPGPEHTILRTTDNFGTVKCSVLASPGKLDPTDYFELTDFNMSNGHGAVVGKIVFEDGARTTWYRSTSEDGGEHFGIPMVVAHKPKVIPGDYLEVSSRGIRDLIYEIRSTTK